MSSSMKNKEKKVSTKIAFVSLGCDKNTVDSEIMIELLAEKGYEIIKEEDQAEVIVVNLSLIHISEPTRP